MGINQPQSTTREPSELPAMPEGSIQRKGGEGIVSPDEINRLFERETPDLPPEINQAVDTNEDDLSTTIPDSVKDKDREDSDTPPQEKDTRREEKSDIQPAQFANKLVEEHVEQDLEKGTVGLRAVYIGGITGPEGEAALLAWTKEKYPDRTFEVNYREKDGEQWYEITPIDKDENTEQNTGAAAPEADDDISLEQLAQEVLTPEDAKDYQGYSLGVKEAIEIRFSQGKKDQTFILGDIKAGTTTTQVEQLYRKILDQVGIEGTVQVTQDENTGEYILSLTGIDIGESSILSEAQIALQESLTQQINDEALSLSTIIERIQNEQDNLAPIQIEDLLRELPKGLEVRNESSDGAKFNASQIRQLAERNNTPFIWAAYMELYGQDQRERERILNNLSGRTKEQRKQLLNYLQQNYPDGLYQFEGVFDDLDDDAQTTTTARRSRSRTPNNEGTSGDYDRLRFEATSNRYQNSDSEYLQLESDSDSQLLNRALVEKRVIDQDKENLDKLRSGQRLRRGNIEFSETRVLESLKRNISQEILTQELRSRVIQDIIENTPEAQGRRFSEYLQDLSPSELAEIRNKYVNRLNEQIAENTPDDERAKKAQAIKAAVNGALVIANERRVKDAKQIAQEAYNNAQKTGLEGEQIQAQIDAELRTQNMPEMVGHRELSVEALREAREKSMENNFIKTVNEKLVEAERQFDSPGVTRFERDKARKDAMEALESMGYNFDNEEELKRFVEVFNNLSNIEEIPGSGSTQRTEYMRRLAREATSDIERGRRSSHQRYTEMLTVRDRLESLGFRNDEINDYIRTEYPEEYQESSQRQDLFGGIARETLLDELRSEELVKQLQKDLERQTSNEFSLRVENWGKRLKNWGYKLKLGGQIALLGLTGGATIGIGSSLLGIAGAGVIPSWGLVGVTGLPIFAALKGYKNKDIRELTEEVWAGRDEVQDLTRKKKNKNQIIEFFQDAYTYNQTGELSRSAASETMFQAFGIEAGKKDLTPSRFIGLINQNIRILGKIEDKIQEQLRNRGFDTNNFQTSGQIWNRNRPSYGFTQ